MKYKNKSMIIDAFKWTGDQDQIEDPVWIVEAIKKGEVSFADLSSNPYKRNVKMIIILNVVRWLCCVVTDVVKMSLWLRNIKIVYSIIQ